MNDYEALFVMMIICVLFAIIIWLDLKPKRPRKRSKRRRKRYTKEERWALDMLKKQGKKHGLHNWKFELSNRLKNFGVTYYSSKTIRISTQQINKHSQNETMDTILHEIAHALAGHEAGHGKVWKDIAKRIGVTHLKPYSKNIERLL